MTPPDFLDEPSGNGALNGIPASLLAPSLRAAGLDDAPTARRAIGYEQGLAVLDGRLYGESVVPVAEALVVKSIPFVFATGYGRDGVPEPYRNRPVLQKPFSKADLQRAIESLGGAHGSA